MNTNNLKGRKLNDGTNKKGEKYARSMNFQPGYGDLLHIIAGLQKKVDRINQCVTLEGAKEYAASKGKNWSAHEEDITGSDGKPDGIKEVFVCDNKGNLKVINGYALSKTDYPYRKAYRTENNTKDKRKAYPYNEFMKNATKIADEFDEDGAPFYETPLGSISPEFANVQPEITPKNLYKQVIFKPMYDEVKGDLKEQGVEPILMARIFNTALSDAFNRHIKNQVLAQMLGGADPDGYDEKIINKLLKSKEYKTECQRLIYNILNNQEDFSTVQKEASDCLNETIDNFLA